MTRATTRTWREHGIVSVLVLIFTWCLTVPAVAFEWNRPFTIVDVPSNFAGNYWAEAEVGPENEPSNTVWWQCSSVLGDTYTSSQLTACYDQVVALSAAIDSLDQFDELQPGTPIVIPITAAQYATLEAQLAEDTAASVVGPTPQEVLARLERDIAGLEAADVATQDALLTSLREVEERLEDSVGEVAGESAAARAELRERLNALSDTLARVTDEQAQLINQLSGVEESLAEQDAALSEVIDRLNEGDVGELTSLQEWQEAITAAGGTVTVDALRQAFEETGLVDEQGVPVELVTPARLEAALSDALEQYVLQDETNPVVRQSDLEGFVRADASNPVLRAGDIEGVEDQSQATLADSWRSLPWWWQWLPLLLLALIVLSVLVLYIGQWRQRQRQQEQREEFKKTQSRVDDLQEQTDTERGRLDNVKGTADEAHRIATEARNLHFGDWSLEESQLPKDDEELAERLPNDGDQLKVMLKHHSSGDTKEVVFKRKDHQFEVGQPKRPAMIAEGIAGQRQPRALTRRSMMQALVKLGQGGRASTRKTAQAKAANAA